VHEAVRAGQLDKSRMLMLSCRFSSGKSPQIYIASLALHTARPRLSP